MFLDSSTIAVTLVTLHSLKPSLTHSLICFESDKSVLAWHNHFGCANRSPMADPWSPYSLLANSPEWNPASLLIFHTLHCSEHWVSLHLRPWLSVFCATQAILLGCLPRKGVRFLQKSEKPHVMEQSDRQEFVEMFKFSFWTQDRSHPILHWVALRIGWKQL